MSQTTILTRAEIESMGPPMPEELAETGIAEGFLCDLGTIPAVGADRVE